MVCQNESLNKSDFDFLKILKFWFKIIVLKLVKSIDRNLNVVMAFLNSMNLKLVATFVQRRLSTTSNFCALKKCYLPNRSLVHVQGEEAPELLQGLMTNDIEHLGTGRGGSIFL